MWDKDLRRNCLKLIWENATCGNGDIGTGDESLVNVFTASMVEDKVDVFTELKS